MARSLSNTLREYLNKANDDSLSAGEFAWFVRFQPNESEKILLTSAGAVTSIDSEDYNPCAGLDITFEESQDSASKLTLTMAVVGSVMRRTMREYNAFLDRTVTAYFAHSGAASTANAIRFDFIITDASIGENTASFQLANSDLTNRLIPPVKVTRGNCPFSYKGDLCGYSGGLTSCDKSLLGPNGCVAHSNGPRFGGFRSLP